MFLQFFFGWWLAIDAAAVYTAKSEEGYKTDLKDVFHICGVFATISMFMINGVSSAALESPDSYTDGCLGTNGARIWFFFGCLMGFGSLIGASYILFGEYVTQRKKTFIQLSTILIHTKSNSCLILVLTRNYLRSGYILGHNAQNYFGPTLGGY